MTGKRKQQALSAALVRTAISPGMYADGNGLNLKVEPTGAKRWIQRVTIRGKRSNLGLGGFPAVSLAEARELASDNQRAIRRGRDPLAEKRQSAEERRRPALPTFAQAAEQVIEMRRPTWSNSKHAAQWKSTLSTYAYPVIGSKYLDEIKSSDVLTVLTPIWTSKPETASRVRQRLETVFDWAIAQGWRLDNPAGKAIARVLPSVPRGKNHHTALKDYADVPATLEQVKRSTAELETRLSLEFLVLTAARSSEVRLARWSEIDWESKTWTIPEDRMKARREHRRPPGRPRTGNFGRGAGIGRARKRVGVSSRPEWKAVVQRDPPRFAPASWHTSRSPRLPKQLQGLVHGAHRYPVDCGGGRLGSYLGQFNGSSLRQKRPF